MISFLKKVLSIFRKSSKELTPLYTNYSAGDIVYANMPLSKQELLKIPEGHRTRPYYIAYIDKEYLIAYPFYSHIRKTNDMNTYLLNHILYPEFDKDSFLSLSEKSKLVEKNIISKICHLKKHDVDQIQRRLYFKDKRAYLSLYKNKPNFAEPIKGDVILYKQKKYFILEDGEQYKLLCFCSFKNHKPDSSSIIKLNGFPFLVNYNNEIIVKKDDYEIKHIANIGDYRKVVAEYAKYKKKLKKRRKHAE